jgi:hypothetical protein
MTPDLKWYASRDGENFTVGPYGTRDEAVAEARGIFDGRFYVVQAAQDPLRLSATVDGMDVIENAECQDWTDFADPDGVDPLMDHVTDDQVADLTARLRKATDEWQDWHGIVIHPWAFTRQGGVETIELENGE